MKWTKKPSLGRRFSLSHKIGPTMCCACAGCGFLGNAYSTEKRQQYLLVTRFIATFVISPVTEFTLFDMVHCWAPLQKEQSLIVTPARTYPNPSEKTLRDKTCASQFNHRVVLLAGAACLGAVAAVCSLLLSGTPLHVITTNTAAAIDLGSASRDRGTPVVAADAAAGASAGGGLGRNDLLVVPVPLLRDDEPQTPAVPAAAAAAAAADTPNKKRWGRRRLADESTPLSAALLDFSAGGDAADGGGNEIDHGDQKKNGSGPREEPGSGEGGGRRGPRFLASSKDATEDGYGHDEDDDDDDMREHEDEATEDDGGGVCSPLEVVGLDNCPEMKARGVVEKLLAAKADILRQV